VRVGEVEVDVTDPVTDIVGGDKDAPQATIGPVS
jgi:hypothetical protein